MTRSDWIAIAALLVSIASFLIPMLRDYLRDRDMDKVVVEVRGVPQIELGVQELGYQPIRASSDAAHSLVLHVANLGRLPVFIRDVRTLLRDPHYPNEGPFTYYYFRPMPESTEALGARESRYYTLPLDEKLLGRLCNGPGPTRRADVQLFVEVRDHRGVVWSGVPDFGSDVSEANIGLSQRKVQAGIGADASPVSPD